MVCIYCHAKTKVTNSRATRGVWRRRECLSCSSIFTTYELPDYESVIRVQKGPQAALRAFSRDILFVSILEALSHRKTVTGDASALCDTVIDLLLAEHSNGLLTNKHIALTTEGVLKRFDRVAASVYAARHLA